MFVEVVELREEDFVRDIGYLALANRLKRLSEVMMASGRKLYKSLELDIEPGWYLIFLLLKKHSSLTVTEMAQKLHYSHPSVVSIVAKMDKQGYVTFARDVRDGRKQRVSLSDKALERMPYFEHLWQAGEAAMRSLFAPDDPFFDTLNDLDRRLKEKSFQQRTEEALAQEEADEIRSATEADIDGIWSIFQPVVNAGDTYVFPVDTPKSALAECWLAPDMRTFVYIRGGESLGTYIIKANQMGAGGHTANASFMVHPDAQGTGIGRKMLSHCLDEARRMGFSAMQFNFVVASNHAAIALWKEHGFAIVGTVPEGFLHPTLGLIDVHIMHRKL